MRREDLIAAFVRGSTWVRATAGRAALALRRTPAALRALGGDAARAGGRALHTLRTLDREAVRAQGRRAWVAMRRRPDALLAAGLVTGVLVMILHWS